VSLIEEALRKQREETEQSSHESTPLKLAGATQPPPPLPEQESPDEEPPAQRRSWALLGAIVGIGLLLVIALIWLLFFGMKLWQSPQARASATVAVTETRPAAGPTGTVAVVVTEGREISNAPAATHTATVAVSLEAPSTNPALPVSPAIPPVIVVQTAAGSIPPPPRDVPLVKGATTNLTARPEAAVWPKLVISGFISAAHGVRGAAIVNGQMVGPGDMVEGVKVIAVDKHGVQFRYGSETQTLAVGGTTD